MCGQGGVPEDCVKYRSWYMAQLTYSSLSCYECNESSNKALSFKKKLTLFQTYYCYNVFVLHDSMTCVDLSEYLFFIITRVILQSGHGRENDVRIVTHNEQSAWPDEQINTKLAHSTVGHLNRAWTANKLTPYSG
jgi:hypothetical protein